VCCLYDVDPSGYPRRAGIRESRACLERRRRTVRSDNTESARREAGSEDFVYVRCTDRAGDRCASGALLQVGSARTSNQMSTRRRGRRSRTRYRVAHANRTTPGCACSGFSSTHLVSHRWSASRTSGSSRPAWVGSYVEPGPLDLRRISSHRRERFESSRGIGPGSTALRFASAEPAPAVDRSLVHFLNLSAPPLTRSLTP
jgi:hypothetical protein